MYVSFSSGEAHLKTILVKTSRGRESILDYDLPVVEGVVVSSWSRRSPLLYIAIYNDDDDDDYDDDDDDDDPRGY